MTPYRINVFATQLVKGKRSRTFCELKAQGIGWQAWTPQQHCGQEARLPSAGSFLFAGALVAITTARRAFDNPRVHQVAIKTNQDRDVLRYYRHADNTIHCYAGE